MRAASRISAAAVLALAATAQPARADEAELMEKIRRLEARVEELEQERREAPSREMAHDLGRARQDAAASDWTQHVRFSGSSDAGYFAGPRESVFEGASFQIWDSRFFVEAELGRDVTLGETTLVRDVGFLFEWDLVRIGYLFNDVGELYVDFQGIGDSDLVSAQVGRFQLPVGEAYLQYSQGYADRAFVTNPVGGAWWWDEGVRIYGSALENRIGYVASVTNGNTPFNYDENHAKQLTLKLFANPTDWLHVSVSGLRSGQLGSSNQPASGSLWIGETWAQPLGASSPVPTYDHGSIVPTGPSEIDDSYYAGIDVIMRWPDAVKLWLSYGRYAMHSSGPSLYDRALQEWIAELVVQGALVSPLLQPFYLGVRSSGLGTFDDDEGYLLDFRLSDTFGYDMKWLTELSVVAGWHLTRHVTVRAEYTLQDVGVVRGAGSATRDGVTRANLFALEVGADF